MDLSLRFDKRKQMKKEERKKDERKKEERKKEEKKKEEREPVLTPSSPPGEQQRNPV